MIGIEHWVIEGSIVLLGLWAVWKTLPRDPNIPWETVQQHFIQAMKGEEIADPFSPQPFTLLEWSQVQTESADLRNYICKRLSEWIVVGSQEMVEAWNPWCTREGVLVDWGDSESILVALEECLTERSQRFVFVVSAADANQLMKLLHANPAVRDFTGAVVLLEPILEDAWMVKHFNNKDMDVEANISVPYFVCQPPGISFQYRPPKDESGWKAIEVIQCNEQLQQWFKADNPMWIQILAMLMVKRKESV